MSVILVGVSKARLGVCLCRSTFAVAQPARTTKANNETILASISDSFRNLYVVAIRADQELRLGNLFFGLRGSVLPHVFRLSPPRFFCRQICFGAGDGGTLGESWWTMRLDIGADGRLHRRISAGTASAWRPSHGRPIDKSDRFHRKTALDPARFNSDISDGHGK